MVFDGFWGYSTYYPLTYHLWQGWYCCSTGQNTLGDNYIVSLYLTSLKLHKGDVFKGCGEAVKSSSSQDTNKREARLYYCLKVLNCGRLKKIE